MVRVAVGAVAFLELHRTLVVRSHYHGVIRLLSRVAEGELRLQFLTGERVDAYAWSCGIVRIIDVFMVKAVRVFVIGCKF